MRQIVVLSVLALLTVLSFAPVAVAADVPAAELPVENIPADAAAPSAEPAAAEQCAATGTAVEVTALLPEADYSCLVCWRDRDCNTYCGGPWGVCSQGCCACTM